MSFQVFMSDLEKEDLSLKRLQQVWEYQNLKNKSPLIDTLSRAINNAFISESQTSNIPIDNVVFTPDRVKRMNKKFIYEIVKRNITSTKILLEQIPTHINVPNDKWVINSYTSLIFQPKKNDIKIDDSDPSNWIAVRVLKSGKLYPLKLSHINMCIGNGWYFNTDIVSYHNCPFYTALPQ